MKRLLLAISIVLVVFAVASKDRIISFIERRQEIAVQEQVKLPVAEALASSASTTTSSSSFAPSLPSSSASSSLRAAVNWDVPFTSQAPLGNWDELHQEACEEASVLMVLRYFQGTPIGTPEQADQAIQSLVLRNEELGFPVDDTAEEVIVLLRDQDSTLKTELLHDPSADDLKRVLSEGALVIVPAQGQFLKNPYFTPPGPRYHMLVLRGYTDNGFVITNDPGTKRGEAYVYSWERMLNAIHDWNDGDVENGAKVVVVVRR